MLLEKTPENIVDSQNTNKWIIQQINSEFSLETQVTKFKLSYLRHIMQRLSSLEKALCWQKRKERELPAAKWMDAVARGALFKDLKEQIMNRLSRRKCI